jgi:hypothetical protein
VYPPEVTQRAGSQAGIGSMCSREKPQLASATPKSGRLDRRDLP